MSRATYTFHPTFCRMIGDLLRTSLIGTFSNQRTISTKCANETFSTMETSYSTQSLHGAPPWSPHHLQQPREGRTIKEGGVLQRFYNSPAEFHHKP